MAFLNDKAWWDATMTLSVQLKVQRFMLQRAKEIWREKLAPNYTSTDTLKDKIMVEFATEIINNSRAPNQNPPYLQQLLYAVCEELDLKNPNDIFDNIDLPEISQLLKSKTNEAIDLVIEARYFKEKPIA
ncbi:hypothetical protein [Floridanema evergladense]|uniref:Uncharacterized protein n=1 Tax=Floridaenema evergladense BLCC-F167 TaxID=3153639 RepID=A0ABV4WCZ3_9CYAN